ncbi:TPA: hypothetical protein ACF24D_002528 [Escherichia coli]
MDETTDKEKAGNPPACLDLYSLSFQLTNYVTKILSNLTACLSKKRMFAPFLVVDEVLTNQYIGQMAANQDAERVGIECLQVRPDKIPKGKYQPLAFLIT